MLALLLAVPLWAAPAPKAHPPDANALVQPQTDFIPARAGWNGPERQPPFNATYETFGPTGTTVQLHEELAQSVKFSFTATIFFAIGIVLCYLLFLRVDRHQKATETGVGRNKDIQDASEADTLRAA
jgi:hypothetical protein